MMITNSALYQSCKCLSFLKRPMSGLVLNLVSQNKNGVEHSKLMHCTYLIKTVHIWQDWDLRYTADRLLP